ncbi:MAG: hypothetical protein ACYDAY_09915 [Candidatus Dormibacteria bacterium]
MPSPTQSLAPARFARAAAGLTLALAAACAPGGAAAPPATGFAAFHVVGGVDLQLKLDADTGASALAFPGPLSLWADRADRALTVTVTGFHGPGTYTGQAVILDLRLGDSRYSTASGGACTILFARARAGRAAGTFTCSGLKPLLAAPGNPGAVDLQAGSFDLALG